MNTKNNQRYRAMEARLLSVLLELIPQMDFEKITVKKICETAQVNRSTFYAHFLDIYDMVEKLETQLHRELLDSYSMQDIEETTLFSERSFFPFLQYIRKHQDFYRIALRTRREFPLKQSYELMWNQIIKPQCEHAGIWEESEMMYYFVYFQAGFTMVLKRWVDTGCKESEAVLTQILKSCVPSIWKPLE